MDTGRFSHLSDRTEQLLSKLDDLTRGIEPAGSSYQAHNSSQGTPSSHHISANNPFADIAGLGQSIPANATLTKKTSIVTEQSINVPNAPSNHASDMQSSGQQYGTQVIYAEPEHSSPYVRAISDDEYIARASQPHVGATQHMRRPHINIYTDKSAPAQYQPEISHLGSYSPGYAPAPYISGVQPTPNPPYQPPAQLPMSAAPIPYMPVSYAQSMHSGWAPRPVFQLDLTRLYIYLAPCFSFIPLLVCDTIAAKGLGFLVALFFTTFSSMVAYHLTKKSITAGMQSNTGYNPYSTHYMPSQQPDMHHYHHAPMPHEQTYPVIYGHMSPPHYK